MKTTNAIIVVTFISFVVNYFLYKLWFSYFSLPIISIKGIDKVKCISVFDLASIPKVEKADEFIRKYVLKSHDYLNLYENCCLEYNSIKRKSLFSVFMVFFNSLLLAVFLTVVLKISSYKLFCFAVFFIAELLIQCALHFVAKRFTFPFADDFQIYCGGNYDEIKNRFENKTKAERIQYIGFEVKEEKMFDCYLIDCHYDYLCKIKNKLTRNSDNIKLFIAIYCCCLVWMFILI